MKPKLDEDETLQELVKRFGDQDTAALGILIVDNAGDAGVRIQFPHWHREDVDFEILVPMLQKAFGEFLGQLMPMMIRQHLEDCARADCPCRAAVEPGDGSVH